VQVSATSLVRFGLYGRGVGIEGVLEEGRISRFRMLDTCILEVGCGEVNWRLLFFRCGDLRNWIK